MAQSHTKSTRTRAVNSRENGRDKMVDVRSRGKEAGDNRKSGRETRDRGDPTPTRPNVHPK